MSSMPLNPRLTLPTVLLYERADLVSGWVILGMLVFMPWAFGTTQAWSVGLMNVCCGALGVLLALKCWIRWRAGHRAARFEADGNGEARHHPRLTRALAVLTILLLAYCALAALNARADYNPITLTLSYRDYISWLPHTYYRAATWLVLGQYLAYAVAFWAMRDWLRGMSAEEARRSRAGESLSRNVPARLQLVLWVLCLNGAAVSLEGIIQRLAGTDRLLFMVRPHENPWSDAIFGPFAYRSNAAQYLNLIWPMALGFWWWLQRLGSAHGAAAWRRHALLLCAAVMAAGPIVSSSRAGALTAILMLFGVLAVFFSESRSNGLIKLSMFGICLLALAAGWYFGGRELTARFSEMSGGFAARETMYQTARLIVRDHPVFGTGPGTFEHVFQIYRQSHDEYWPAQLHNDWLELLLSFGWVGFSLILLALVVAVMHGFVRAPVHASSRFRWALVLALAGCLLQARWDYPFRVYSVIWLFLLLCATLTLVGRRRS